MRESRGRPVREAMTACSDRAACLSAISDARALHPPAASPPLRADANLGGCCLVPFAQRDFQADGKLGRVRATSSTTVRRSRGWRRNHRLRDRLRLLAELLRRVDDSTSGYQLHRATATSRPRWAISSSVRRSAGVRPYASAVWRRSRSQRDHDRSLLRRASTNDSGCDVGGGMMFFTDNVGIRGDIRYFRSLQRHDANGVDLGARQSSGSGAGRSA